MFGGCTTQFSMNIQKLSASAYKEYSNCPHAYFIGQNLSRRYPAGKAASIGTISHRVIEILSEQKIAAQSQESDIFTTAELGDLPVNSKFDIYDLAVKIFDCLTKKLTHLEWDKKDFEACLGYVNTALFYQDGKFDPRRRVVVDAERRIDLEIEENWAVLPSGNRLRMTGYIDLVCEAGEDTYEIIDWKTGQQKDFHSGEELNEITLRNDIQLKMYHYAATKIYGEDKNYLVTMFFLKTKSPVTLLFGRADLEDTKDKLKQQLVKIQADKSPRRNISYKCKKFCDYGKNTFEGTDINPLPQIYEGGIAKLGDYMTVCDQVYFELSRFNMNWVEENMKYNRNYIAE